MPRVEEGGVGMKCKECKETTSFIFVNLNVWEAMQGANK